MIPGIEYRHPVIESPLGHRETINWSISLIWRIPLTYWHLPGYPPTCIEPESTFIYSPATLEIRGKSWLFKKYKWNTWGNNKMIYPLSNKCFHPLNAHAGRMINKKALSNKSTPLMSERYNGYYCTSGWVLVSYHPVSSFCPSKRRK